MTMIMKSNASREASLRVATQRYVDELCRLIGKQYEGLGASDRETRQCIVDSIEIMRGTLGSVMGLESCIRHAETV